jgi:hypothetical protein
MEGIGIVYFQGNEVAQVHYSINDGEGILTPLNVGLDKLLGKNGLEMKLELEDGSTIRFIIHTEVSDGTFKIKVRCKSS